jgi:basic membrane lipoprotein Med (substrate-binding protein (PBP1-ABC) superfamily)
MGKKLGEEGIAVSTAVIIAVIVTAIIVGPVAYLAKPSEVVEREVRVEVPVKENVIMGFVMGGYISGSTWDGRYKVAAERLKSTFPWFKYEVDEGVVLGGRDPAASARDLIATKKANLVVGSWEPCAVPAFNTIKGEYPNVWFLGNIGSDITRGGNFLRFFPRQYQAMYLEGLVAGAITRTNKIGIAVGPACVQNWRRMAAFYLGIKEVNPAATLYIKYVGEWYKPETEREVSLALADMGCDVLTNYTDSTAPVEVCAERGIWYVGKDTDVVSIGRKDIKMDIIGDKPWSTTDTVAVSFDTRWEVIWYHFAKAYLAGEKAPSTLVFLGMDDGIPVPTDNPFLPGETFIPTVDLQNNGRVGVDAISPKARPLIPDNVIELIRRRREQMMMGQWDPFFEYELVAGVETAEIPGVAPARTPGQVVKPARTAVSDEFLLGQLNFSLAGIVKVA